MAVVLESGRLTLRPIRAADAETLWTIWNDREVYRYVGHLAYGDVPGLDRIQRAARRFEGLWAEQAWGPMTVTRRADGAVVGECGLYPVFDEQGVATSEIELGHRYGRAFWGQGYGREAAGLVMGWATDVLRLDALVSIVNKSNVASRRIAESLGFHLAETREATFEEHTWTDCWYRWQPTRPEVAM